MNLIKPQYTFVDHTADIAVEITASTPCDVLVASFQALEEVLGIDQGAYGGNGSTETAESFRLSLAGGIHAQNLVDALNEWLFQTTHRGLRGRMDTCHWEAESLELIWDHPVWRPEEELETEIKSVTYHNALLKAVDRESGQWKAFWIADT